MERKMETTIRGYIGTDHYKDPIPSFLADQIQAKPCTKTRNSDVACPS